MLGTWIALGRACMDEAFANNVYQLQNGIGNAIPKALDDYMIGEQFRLSRFEYGEITRLLGNSDRQDDIREIRDILKAEEPPAGADRRELYAVLGVSFMDGIIRDGLANAAHTPDNATLKGNLRYFNPLESQYPFLRKALGNPRVVEIMASIDKLSWNHPDGAKHVCSTAASRSNEFIPQRHFNNSKYDIQPMAETPPGLRMKAAQPTTEECPECGHLRAADKLPGHVV